MTMDVQVSTPDASKAIGELVAGRYQLERLLGEGGMGAVYAAKHTEIGKRVAVKVVHAVHLRHPDVEARFRREARSASAIESEHIVHVFDVGQDEKHGLFMVMEFLKGQDLATLLQQNGRMDPFGAAYVIAQAAFGLQKAHDVGIIHRDLKPANLFLTNRDDGSVLVKLVDFGIAKFVRETNEVVGKGITRMGMAIGTPQYMSPEQAQGLQILDGRSDVYSLGAVLYEMLTNEPLVPDYHSYEQTIIHVITKQPARVSETVPDIPEELDDLVADMLEHDVDKRVESMDDVRDRLVACYPDIADVRLPLSALSGEAAKLAIASGITFNGRASSQVVPDAPRSRANPPASDRRSGKATHAPITLEQHPVSDVIELARPTRSNKVYVFAGVGAVAVGLGVWGLSTQLKSQSLSNTASQATQVVSTAVATTAPAASSEIASAQTATSASATASNDATAPPAASGNSSSKITSDTRPPKTTSGGSKPPKTGAAKESPDPPPPSRPGAVNVASEF